MRIASPVTASLADSASNARVHSRTAPPLGHGRVEVELVHGQSTLVRGWASSPLTLLTPRSRARCVWTYTGNLGGGLVAGDQLRLDVRVGAGACAFLGSQASTKVYQNPEDRPCGSTTRASVEQSGLLVFAPDPVQAFAGANYAQDQEFRLEADSGLVLVDWFTAGRVARGERWAFGRIRSRNAIWCAAAEAGSTPDFLDSLRLDATHGPLTAQHRLGRFNCMALLVFVGTRVRDAALRMLEQVAALPVSPRAPLICSASPWKNGALLRVAGVDVSAVSAELRRHLAVLEPLLGDNPWVRKM